MTSITTTLGAGSGIDTPSLVSSLLDAQFGVKTQALTAKKDTLTAQISALAQLKSGLTGFSTALTSLIGGGTLSTQPTSSDATTLGVSLLPGAHIAGTSATIEVQKLATAQVVTAAPVPDKTAAFGKGTLTITLGSAAYTGDTLTGFTAKTGTTPVTVTIGDGQNSLSGIATAINAANAGVTATVVTDGTGSRLSIKGQTGATQAFRVDVVEDGAAPGLSALAFNPTAPTMSLARKSQDSVVALDGVTTSRPGNSISDLVAGVQLDLVKAAPGQTISVGAAPPTAGLSQAVTDIVDTYNQLVTLAKDDTNAASGVLKNDGGVRELMRQLQGLTGKSLYPGAAAGDPTTLAQLGVKTNRDGTLTLDSATLQSVLAKSSGAVEQMLTVGLGSALRTIGNNLTGTGGALTASQTSYTRQQAATAKEQEKVTADSAVAKERLTRQFSGMDARVSAYKSTQSFLEQQIAAWSSRG